MPFDEKLPTLSPAASPRGAREPSSLDVARRAGAAGRGPGPRSTPDPGSADEGVPASITDPSNGLFPVGHGLDSVYLSGRFPIAERFLDGLASARDRLREQGGDEAAPVRIARVAFGLSPKGSERQFFASNDDLRLSLAQLTDSARPNVQLVLSSALLWTRGGDDALASALSFARRLAATGKAPSLLVSRLDLAADVQGVTFPPPDEPRWVTRARHSARYDEAGVMTGMTFGRDKLLVRIYDKSRELQKTGKGWLWKLWLDHGANDSLPVWRVETQLRREALRRFGFDRMRVPADVLGRLDAVWRAILTGWLTLRAGKRVTRWDRAALAPEWAALATLQFGDPVASAIGERLALFNRWRHVRQIRGHLATICANVGLDTMPDGLRVLASDLRELEAMEPGGFEQRLLARRALRARLDLGFGDDEPESSDEALDEAA